MKFVNTGNFKLPRFNTKEYTDLQEKISRSLRQTELSKVPGFRDVKVVNFFSRQDGEFETDVEVIVDENEFLAEDDPLTVKQALEDTVSRGRIGNLKVEPSSLVLGKEGMLIIIPKVKPD